MDQPFIPLAVAAAVPRKRRTPPTTTTNDPVFPDISVSSGGRIDVVWYDWRNDPTYDPEAENDGNELQDVYYTYSTDSGRSWAPNVRVTDRLIDRTVGPSSIGGIRGPLAVSALEQGAYVAWDDTRTATEVNENQDIYFSRVRFERPAAFFSAAAGGGQSWWISGGIAAGAVMGVAGVLLLLLTRTMRSKRVQAPSRAGERLVT